MASCSAARSSSRWRSGRDAKLEMKKVLIIAFHFPPQAGSSGLLRSLKFTKYLVLEGWQPTVLTAHPRAYESLDPARLDEVPPKVKVVRSFALDTQRHLSVGGRYLKWTALPDRWVTWCVSAAWAALRQIRRDHIDVIFTTFPIATTILIGLIIHRMTGKPWVIDFRDSMTEDNYPRDPTVRRVYRWIEEQAVQRGKCLIFTARSTLQLYLDRYPALSPEKCRLILNGYDDEDFVGLTQSPNYKGQQPFYLLHMGELYPEERDPRPFFRALGRLKKEGRADASALKVGLRASGAEDYHARMIRECDIEDLVQLLPALSYREALQEAANADALLLFQGSSCNHQIPAKAYEYLRLRKPILALTTEIGDTAAILRENGGATIVDLADEEAIYQAVPAFLNSARQGRHPLPDPTKFRQYSRRNQAQELAKCLLEISNAAS
jgi:glycosyltransferase involved in cell wall biosynthesis